MRYDKQYYVYILTNKSNLSKLVYFDVTSDIENAIGREKQLKNWHRDWKINLINEINPEWKDLSQSFFENTETGDAETSSA